MKISITMTFLVAALAFSISDAMAQTVLNSNGDELLKEFNVDPATMNKYEPKQTTSKAGMLLKLVESAIPKINVDTTSGDPTVKVKAPFVNVDVHGGKSNVRVNAPFVNVTTGDSGVNVKAPFVNVGSGGNGGANSPQQQGAASPQQQGAPSQQQGYTPQQSTTPPTP